MDRPTWPGHGPGPASGSSEDARTRARPATPPRTGGSPPDQSQDARTRAGGTRAGSQSGTHGGLASGRRAWVPGERVGPFVVKALLGQGGMGAVYTVTHETTGVDYALKVLLAIDDAMGRARFEREGQAQASLPPHPNVVRVFGAGELQGIPYLLTELAPGGDLRMRLRQGPVPPSEACGMFVGLARALEQLHARGVLHRDLKPHNIVFGADGTPKLMDFGLATLRGADKLTATGAFMGTPNYMPPEQVDGQKVDARADVYGLGATLYHALCGRPPYDGESGVNMITKILTQPPRALRSMQPGLPPDVIRVVERAMARDLEVRYASAGALADDLERLASGVPLDPPPSPPGAGRRKRLLAGAGAGLLALVGALIAHRGGAASDAGAPEPPPAKGVPPPVAVAPVSSASTRPSGPYACLLVEGTTEQLPVPPWLEPGELLVRGVAAAAPVERGPAVLLDEPITLLEVRRAGRRVLTLEVVRLPPGVRPIEGGVRAVNDADGSRLVFVPAGPDKLPPFLLGEREVTWEQYGRFLRAAKLEGRTTDGQPLELPPRRIDHPDGSYSEVPGHPDHPVSAILPAEVDQYTARCGLELPSIAEWTHALRGPGLRRYPWGDRPGSPAPANVLPHSVGPAPVGSHPGDVSWCGALDLGGNVDEWVKPTEGTGFVCGCSWTDAADRWVDQVGSPADVGERKLWHGFRVKCRLDRPAAPPPLPD